MIYESTRDINRKLNPSEAILQGLSERIRRRTYP